jgi:two-component system, LytTR family, sensor kinase
VSDAREDLPLRSARLWAVLFLLFTLIGLLNFNIVRTTWLTEHHTRPAKYPFVWEMTGAYSVFALMPAVLAFLRRFPLSRRTLATRLPLHLGLMTLFGGVHTLLMWGSRVAIYRALDWGAYDNGDLRYRFLMEGQKQIAVYWLIVATVTVAAYVRRNRERELRAAHLEKQLSDARLSALKTQLNPHFLFNALNMISSHVYEAPRIADAMIGHLSDFLRLTLRHGDAQEVPLDTELAFLESYLEIMKARFEERLTVEMAIGAGVRAALVPHLILQPIVENSMKHCMDDHTRAGRVRIAADRDGARLRISVEDDGPGLIGTAEPGQGIGLTNTAERLRHLYGEQQCLRIANGTPGGVRVDLELPYRVASGPEAA